MKQDRHRRRRVAGVDCGRCRNLRHPGRAADRRRGQAGARPVDRDRREWPDRPRSRTARRRPPARPSSTCAAKTVMPGLIDVHVHLTGDRGEPWYQALTPKYSSPMRRPSALTQCAGHGARRLHHRARPRRRRRRRALPCATPIREGRFPGPRDHGVGRRAVDHRRAWRRHGRLNPELAAAINEARTQVGVCTGADAMRASGARDRPQRGVDVIKFHATGGVLDPGAMGPRAAFHRRRNEGDRRHGACLHLKVAAHAHGARGIEAAARAGVDSIEHGTFVDDAAIKAMKAQRHLFRADADGVQRRARSYSARASTRPKSKPRRARRSAHWGKALNRAYRAGVKIALGTDAGVFPHGRDGEEVGLMVSKGGMSPARRADRGDQGRRRPARTCRAKPGRSTGQVGRPDRGRRRPAEPTRPR